MLKGQKENLGLLYKGFFGNTNCAALMQFYQSLVYPHMQYASDSE